MRISDWSSDVCSADLLADGVDRLLELLAGDLGLAHGAGEALDALLDAGFQLGHRLEQLVGIAGEVVAAVDLADQRIAHRRQLGVFALQLRDARLERAGLVGGRSEEHTSELQSLMRISYAVFCLKKKKRLNNL